MCRTKGMRQWSTPVLSSRIYRCEFGVVTRLLTQITRHSTVWLGKGPDTCTDRGGPKGLREWYFGLGRPPSYSRCPVGHPFVCSTHSVKDFGRVDCCSEEVLDVDRTSNGQSRWYFLFGDPWSIVAWIPYVTTILRRRIRKPNPFFRCSHPQTCDVETDPLPFSPTRVPVPSGTYRPDPNDLRSSSDLRDVDVVFTTPPKFLGDVSDGHRRPRQETDATLTVVRRKIGKG